MRERYDRRVDIDTCHAAFAFNEEITMAPGLGIYDLIVIDEISQLDEKQFERIRRLWLAVDRVPTL
eukprot:12811076-Prorocentrum_lima.AAC.1